MTQATDALSSDLSEAIAIAKAGRNSPLLGGEIGLMWTGLATVALTLHGLVLMGIIAIAPNLTGLIWATYGVIGTLLSVILGKRIEAKAGARTIANQVSEATWVASGIMIATFAIGMVIVVITQGLSTLSFNFIVPFAFAVSAVSNAVLARLTEHGYLKWAAVGSGVMTALTLLLVAQPWMYLVAAFGLLIAGVIPSWIELRRESAHV